MASKYTNKKPIAKSINNTAKGTNKKNTVKNSKTTSKQKPKALVAKKIPVKKKAAKPIVPLKKTIKPAVKKAAAKKVLAKAVVKKKVIVTKEVKSVKPLAKKIAPKVKTDAKKVAKKAAVPVKKLKFKTPVAVNKNKTSKAVVKGKASITNKKNEKIAANKKAVKTAPTKEKISKEKAISKKVIKEKKISKAEILATAKLAKSTAKKGVKNTVEKLPVKAIVPIKITPELQAAELAKMAVRAKYKKLVLEYSVNSAKHILFNYLSTSSGLAEWFADKIDERGDTMVFYWDEVQQSARLISLREDHSVRFSWLDQPDALYFEFKIEMDEITGDLALIITDFCEDENALQSAKLLWNSQIDDLFDVLGVH